METAPSTLTNWPGAFGVINESKRVVLSNWRPILILAIVSGISNGVGNRQDDHWALTLASTVITIVTGVALLYALLLATKGEKATLGQSMKFALSLTSIKYFFMILLSLIIVVASLVAFVIPFFFVAPRLVLAEMFLVDKGMGPLESIKASWAATKGHVGKLYGILGVYILFIIACLVLIGFYFLFIYMATLPLLYRFATSEVAKSPEPQSSIPSNTPTPIA